MTKNSIHATQISSFKYVFIVFKKNKKNRCYKYTFFSKTPQECGLPFTRHSGQTPTEDVGL